MASDMESSPNTSDDERGRGTSAEPNKKSSEKRKRSRNWTDDETRILISVVRDHYPDLRKAKRNEHVYVRMHKEAVELKLNRSLAEIKTKWKSLAATFKTEHAEHTGTGTSPSEWPFYEELSSFLGSIATNNHNVVETSSRPGSGKKNGHRQSSSKRQHSSDNSSNNSLSHSPNPSSSPSNTGSAESIVRINKGASTSGLQSKSPLNTGAAESNVRINDGASTSGLQSDGANTKRKPEEDFFSDEDKDETTPAKKRPRVASDKKKSSFQLIQEDIKESTAASIRFGDQMEKAFNVFTPLMQSIGQTLNSVLPQLVGPGNGPTSQPYQNHGHNVYGAPAYNPYNTTHLPNPSFNGRFANGTHFAHNRVTDQYPYYNHPLYNPNSVLNGSYSNEASQRVNEPPFSQRPPYNPTSMLNGSLSNEAAQHVNEPPFSQHPPYNPTAMLNGSYSNEGAQHGNEPPPTHHPPNNPNSMLNGASSSEMPPRDIHPGTSGEYPTF